MSDKNLIKTEGDFEAVIFHESMEAFTSIISKDLYSVYGEAPHQNIYFHNSSCFNLFCIHVSELFAESTVFNTKESLFSGGEKLALKYKKEGIDASNLLNSIKVLESWLNEEPPFSFDCPDINERVVLKLSRKEALSYAQLFSKHNLFNLTRTMSKLESNLKENNSNVEDFNILNLVEPFLGELKENRTIYHASYLIEMLFNYFTELNRLANHLYMRSPTNRMNDFKYPEGISSSAFKGLYFSALRFANSYNKSHYGSLEPNTTEYLKMRY